jgi:hypothetical protein
MSFQPSTLGFLSEAPEDRMLHTSDGGGVEVEQSCARLSAQAKS